MISFHLLLYITVSSKSRFWSSLPMVVTLKDDTTKASAITFLEFMDGETYIDNKNKLDKIIKSQLI